MPQLFYTDASITDLPQIVAIYNETIPGRMVTADLEPVTVQSRIAWFEKHLPGKRPIWIVKNENKEVVGWVSFTNFYGRPAYDATAEISIYLSTAQQGKGYGREILKHCTDSCAILGIENLVGFIFAHNEPSLKLFYSCGFTDWGTLPEIAVLDGVKRSLKIVGRHVS